MHQLLIVDDSKLQRGFLKQALRQLDCVIHEASNGLEALQVIEISPPDCMILDLMMPEMNGFELLRALKDRRLVLPIVIATTDMLDETRRACIDLGALDVIYKPLNELEVTRAVHRALALSENPSPSASIPRERPR